MKPKLSPEQQAEKLANFRAISARYEKEAEEQKVHKMKLAK